ncbi:Rz1-like lysis system protein LysC [Caballeronia sp. DA-9]|uniref:Rz1-like lysis system protein LysC n=1 Tax=Caballeronia sp. DA-9 TaxID=3436237 RepID=UPI003F67326F
MKTKPIARGPMLLCLTMLCACSQAPLSPAPAITLQECQRVTPCTMPAVSLRTNGDLRDALDVARAAWAVCAAQVDMIVDCQAKTSDE